MNDMLHELYNVPRLIDVTTILAAAPQVQVGTHPTPDGTQPMTAAEFRMTREYLGLTGDQLAALTGRDARTIRRYESGAQVVPDEVRLDIELLEQVHASIVAALVAQLAVARENVLTIPTPHKADGANEAVGGLPRSWWRSVAYEVALQVPGLHVRYSDE